ncbi:hypothetical protein EMIT0P294_20386 [Pseudomonas sp. IT-P294]
MVLSVLMNSLVSAGEKCRWKLPRIITGLPILSLTLVDTFFSHPPVHTQGRPCGKLHNDIFQLSNIVSATVYSWTVGSAHFWALPLTIKRGGVHIVYRQTLRRYLANAGQSLQTFGS